MEIQIRPAASMVTKLVLGSVAYNASTGAPLPLQVQIIDDGPGIPPAIAEDIFEPFVSGRDGGTGLGLTIAELGDRFEIAGMYAAILFVVLCSASFFFLTEKLETWLLSAR